MLAHLLCACLPSRAYQQTTRLHRQCRGLGSVSPETISRRGLRVAPHRTRGAPKLTAAVRVPAAPYARRTHRRSTHRDAPTATHHTVHTAPLPDAPTAPPHRTAPHPPPRTTPRPDAPHRTARHHTPAPTAPAAPRPTATHRRTRGDRRTAASRTTPRRTGTHPDPPYGMRGAPHRTAAP
ncbi:hypothetical protein B0H12DRAFT_1236946 [Mycena haematopus]|nr:hypothetical protein B0H12DRAFT_1236946 [Mycena haematopus]